MTPEQQAAAAAQARDALRQRPVRPSHDHPLGATQQGLLDGMVDAMKREQQQMLRDYHRQVQDRINRMHDEQEQPVDPLQWFTRGPYGYTWHDTAPPYDAHSDANRHTQPLHHTLPDREGVYNITTLED